jgi:exodeoxyribonuclease V
MKMIELTKEQLNAKNGIVESFRYGKKIVKLVGFAGTGKTTLINEFVKSYRLMFPHKRILNIAFVTYSGKASSVLKSKILGVFDKLDFCGTIHSMMYKPEIKKDLKTGKTVIVKWIKQEYLDFDLIVVDEASMLPKEIFDDLKSYDIPMLLVGDQGQLPSVSENTKSMIDNPDFSLIGVHRQCADNPIIILSTFVRNNGVLPEQGIWGKSAFKFQWNHQKCQELFNGMALDDDLMILCGFNKTRVKLNNLIRERLGYVELNEPYPGERVICLQNNREAGIMNGQTGTLLLSIPKSSYISEMTIKMDGVHEIYTGDVNLLNFGKETFTRPEKDYKNKYVKNKAMQEKSCDFFEYGYAISVHKSQGSEWDNIVLFEQKSSHWDDNYYAKWLYTGITRARNKLFIIGNYWE